MSKTRQEEQHAAVREEIKKFARLIMEKEGTANVSIRGIGRQMKLTAPALYHYYPNRDALVTDLIFDAYNALADALEHARDLSSNLPLAEQLLNVLMAYRAWALQHPVDFELIYGNPIPGYGAPQEVTGPAANRTFIIIAGLVTRAMESSDFTPRPEYSRIPEEMGDSIRKLAGEMAAGGVALPELALYLTAVGWPRIHGIIMLELFNHIQPVIGGVDNFYRVQVEDMIRAMGLKEY
jgi:AcrR family transcriptional regulator